MEISACSSQHQPSSCKPSSEGLLGLTVENLQSDPPELPSPTIWINSFLSRLQAHCSLHGLGQGHISLVRTIHFSRAGLFSFEPLSLCSNGIFGPGAVASPTGCKLELTSHMSWVWVSRLLRAWYEKQNASVPPAPSLISSPWKSPSRTLAPLSLVAGLSPASARPPQGAPFLLHLECLAQERIPTARWLQLCLDVQFFTVPLP